MVSAQGDWSAAKWLRRGKKREEEWYGPLRHEEYIVVVRGTNYFGLLRVLEHHGTSLSSNCTSRKIFSALIQKLLVKSSTRLYRPSRTLWQEVFAWLFDITKIFFRLMARSTLKKYIPLVEKEDKIGLERPWIKNIFSRSLMILSRSLICQNW